MTSERKIVGDNIVKLFKGPLSIESYNCVFLVGKWSYGKSSFSQIDHKVSAALLPSPLPQFSSEVLGCHCSQEL